MRIAFANGLSIVIIAGGATLFSLLFTDWTGVLVGLLVTSGGAMEMYGRYLIGKGDKKGCQWLMNAQLLLIAVIAYYCGLQLRNFDADELMGHLPQELETSIAQAGIDIDRMKPIFTLMSKVLYGSVIFLTLIYQGGMYFYYRKRRPAVLAAIDQSALTP